MAVDNRVDARRTTAMGREIDLQMIGAKVGQAFVEQLRVYTRTCLSCTKFDEKQEECKQYGKRPPARIIAYGCPDYEEIPPF